MDGLDEIAPFLAHANPSVRAQAAKVLVSVSAAGVALHDAVGKLAFMKTLARLIADRQEIAKDILTALVNFSDSQALRAQMLEANIVNLCMDALRDKNDTNHRLQLMLLANLSRDPDGASRLMQEGEAVQGLHVIRLLQWFIQPSSGTTPEADPYQYIAYILTNISQLPSARGILLDRERGVLKHMKEQTQSASSVRRLGVFNAIRNCCFNIADQTLVLSPEIGMLPYLLLPLVGSEPFEDNETSGMLPSVLAANKPGKEREPLPEIRKVILDAILLCAREASARTILKDAKVFPILRDLHSWERENKVEDIDDFIEDLVPYFILKEEDGSIEAHSQKLLDHDVAEEKKRRVAYLQNVNRAESKDSKAPAAATAPSTSGSAPAAAAPPVKVTATSSAPSTIAATAAAEDDDAPPPLHELEEMD